MQCYKKECWSEITKECSAIRSTSTCFVPACVLHIKAFPYPRTDNTRTIALNTLPNWLPSFGGLCTAQKLCSGLFPVHHQTFLTLASYVAMQGVPGLCSYLRTTGAPTLSTRTGCFSYADSLCSLVAKCPGGGGGTNVCGQLGSCPNFCSQATACPAIA